MGRYLLRCCSCSFSRMLRSEPGRPPCSAMMRSSRSWSSTRGNAVTRLVVIEASESAACRGPGERVAHRSSGDRASSYHSSLDAAVWAARSSTGRPRISRRLRYFAPFEWPRSNSPWREREGLWRLVPGWTSRDRRRRALLEVLRLAPGLLDRDPPLARDEDAQVVLVRHAVATGVDSDLRHVGVGLEVVVQAATQPNERRDRGVPDTPEPVRVVAADDAGQRIRLAKSSRAPASP